jgi:hypothetical protein
MCMKVCMGHRLENFLKRSGFDKSCGRGKLRAQTLQHVTLSQTGPNRKPVPFGTDREKKTPPAISLGPWVTFVPQSASAFVNTFPPMICAGRA